MDRVYGAPFGQPFSMARTHRFVEPIGPNLDPLRSVAADVAWGRVAIPSGSDAPGMVLLPLSVHGSPIVEARAR